MATGRLQVGPGQVIQSASWGNLVWDQSVNAFASAADRDNQWPAPLDGALSFLADKQRVDARVKGAWRPLMTATPGASGNAVYTLSGILGKTIVPASGSQFVITLANVALVRSVHLQYYGTFQWFALLRAITASQINANLFTIAGAAIPDNTAFNVSYAITVEATPGLIPSAA